MEPIIPLTLSDFPEDVQLCIISFLDRPDLEAFACTSKKFCALCNEDERLWFLRCRRRWGSLTQIKKWGGGKISYNNLFRLLNQYENLIGFWSTERYFQSSPNSQLVLFEWGSFYITGYKVYPSKCGGYDVVKKPFLWITATSDGQTLNYLDRNETVSITEHDLSRQDSEKLRSGDLIVVDIYSMEAQELKFRENKQFFKFRKLVDTGNKHGVEYESVYKTPPDGLMAQLCEILARNSSVTGNLPSRKEQRRKERQREKEQQRRICILRSERFRKIMNPSPTPSRPLQGLWKGIGPNKSLNIYLVLYRENCFWCGIVVGSYDTGQFDSRTVFASRNSSFLDSPLTSEEEHTYNERTHLRPIANRDRATSFEDEDLDVSRICHVFSSRYYHGYHENPPENPDTRVWLYANGTFGFGCLRDDYIVDLKPVAKNGLLFDAI